MQVNSSNMLSWLNGFVKWLAGFASPRTFTKVNYPSFSASWIQSLRVSKWRTFPIPVRLAMDLATEKSIANRIKTTRPKSSANALAPNPSDAAFTKATNSDSADDKAIVAWVELQSLITIPLNRSTPPVVDFLVLKHPAQSA